MKKMLSGLLFLTFLITSMTITGISAEENFDFAGGDGTEENPYQITTAEQLNNVRNYLNSYFIQLTDINLERETSKGGICWNEGKGWIPINNFKGTYDGNGRTISNIQCFSTGKNRGLFGIIDGGTVKNLSIIDSDFRDTLGVVTNKGGIAGSVVNGRIENCFNNSDISSTDTSYVGGIVGYASDVSVIENCCNTGNIIGGRYVGGIVGKSEGKHIYGTNSMELNSVSYCYNSGKIEGEYDSGGIVGLSKLTSTKYCGNNGYISLDTDSESGNIGGINGSCQGSYVFECMNFGTVSSNVSSNSGGIVGKAINYSLTTSTGTFTRIDNCYNISTVSSAGFNGGILGLTENTLSSSMPPTIIIRYCYNIGNVYNSSSLKVGNGIVGSYNRMHGITETKIESCYTLKDVAKGNSTTIIELDDISMKKQSSFTGFDFDTVWNISSETNDGYPYLQKIPTKILIKNVSIVKTTSDSYEYEFCVESPGRVSGKFILGLYVGDALISTVSQEISSINRETVSGNVQVSKLADSYKAFLWSDLSTLMPVCEAVSGTIN